MMARRIVLLVVSSAFLLGGLAASVGAALPAERAADGSLSAHPAGAEHVSAVKRAVLDMPFDGGGKTGDDRAVSDVAATGSVAFAPQLGKFSQVHILDVGRGSVQQITRDAVDHYDPGWSRDGRRLAFSSSGEERGGFYPSSIEVVDVGTAKRFVPLFDPKSSSGDLAHALLSPALSPNGRRLCFTDQGWNIAVAPSDRRTGTWKALALGVDCSWSPDGEWIAFTRLIVGPSREEDGVYVTSLGIWRMRPDGSNLRRVTSGSDWEPDWSPDGKRIALTRRTRAGTQIRWNILVASATGRGARRLASGNSPTWSPDGRRMAFSRNKNERGVYGSDIYVMSADGSGPRLLLPDAFAPDWGAP